MLTSACTLKVVWLLLSKSLGSIMNQNVFIDSQIKSTVICSNYTFNENAFQDLVFSAIMLQTQMSTK